jgi:hypothetical protein
MRTEYAPADVLARAEQTPHTVVRLDFVATDPYAVLRDRFEAAVPAFDLAVVADAADWATVETRTTAAAPHDFLRYATINGSPLFAIAGHVTSVTTYLMGNHVFAEQMFRQDPGILLYAPLRVTIHQDKAGRAHLSVDQPSTRFASFGDPQITAVGEVLDAKLAALVTHLGLAAA